LSQPSGRLSLALKAYALALKIFAVYIAVAVSLYNAVGRAQGQHWITGALASLLAADGICDVGVAVYLRVVRKRPHRNEILFVAIALATAALGWYALRSASSFALVAGATVAIVLVRRSLKPHLFDPWSLEAVDPNFVVFRTDDAGLEAAKAQARATLPEFLKRLSAPGADVTSAAVKAPLPVPGGSEHVWLSGIQCDGDEFVGTVENHPSPGTGVQMGATVRISQTDISDWKLVERGQLVGGFTIRYFMSLMDPAQEAAMRAGLPFAIGPEAIPPTA
jgi:uncharacterized protein YegJ (DUF2314 family)